MLNPELFPVDVDFSIRSTWDTEKSHRRQVVININGLCFAVINCDYIHGKWQEPSFVIMRAAVPIHELDLVSEIVIKAKVIMLSIGQPNITKEELEKLL